MILLLFLTFKFLDLNVVIELLFHLVFTCMFRKEKCFGKLEKNVLENFNFLACYLLITFEMTVLHNLHTFPHDIRDILSKYEKICRRIMS